MTGDSPSGRKRSCECLLIRPCRRGDGEHAVGWAASRSAVVAPEPTAGLIAWTSPGTAGPHVIRGWRPGRRSRPGTSRARRRILRRRTASAGPTVTVRSGIPGGPPCAAGRGCPQPPGRLPVPGHQPVSDSRTMAAYRRVPGRGTGWMPSWLNQRCRRNVASDAPRDHRHHPQTAAVRQDDSRPGDLLPAEGGGSPPGAGAGRVHTESSRDPGGLGGMGIISLVPLARAAAGRLDEAQDGPRRSGSAVPSGLVASLAAKSAAPRQIEMATGWAWQRKRYQEYRARTERLPAGYRTAIDALERYWSSSGPGRATARCRCWRTLPVSSSRARRTELRSAGSSGTTREVRRGVSPELPGGSVDQPGAGERYRFAPARRVLIPKKNGKLRPLSPPAKPAP
jgi:hypothetical protein